MIKTLKTVIVIPLIDFDVFIILPMSNKAQCLMLELCFLCSNTIIVLRISHEILLSEY